MIRNLFFTLACSFLIGIASISVGAQGTEFIYQGSLQDGANPANGLYDLEFALFDALSAGTQLGTTQTVNGVTVTSGSFSVPLDFGSQFPGASRFLEIRVRPSGGGAFTPLAPRQPVKSAPYSIKSINAENAVSAATATNSTQLGGVAADQYVLSGDSRLSDARNPLAGSANYIQNQNAAPQASSNFDISGTGRASIFNAMTQFSIGGNRVLSSPVASNIFVGVGAGNLSMTGTFNSFLGLNAGDSNTTGSNNAFFGQNAGQANTQGGSNSFFGETSGFLTNTGFGNSFFGASAGLNNTLGNDNLMAGRDAGLTNTTGSNNTIIGANANVGINNLTFATAIGSGATVTASNTIALGRAIDTVQVPGGLNVAGSSNFSGTLGANIFNATTQFNIGGSRVLALGGSGSSTFVGVGAGQNGSGSLSNSFFGGNAGFNSTIDALSNSFFGVSAGFANQSGDNNSLFGVNAGSANETGSGNSFFGSSAGDTNVDGILNTAIGISADFGFASLINATAIGARAMVTQDNSLVLGSINGVNGATGNTNVGIGTTAPARRLHVSNGVSGATAFSGTDFIIEDDVSAFQQFLTPNDAESGILFGDVTDSIGGGIVFNNAATNNGIQFRSGGNETRMTLDGSGNLGVVGTVLGNIINSATQYNIGGNRVLSIGGANNFFAGVGAGQITTGSSNTFVGRSSGLNNTTGARNSFFGDQAGRENETGSSNSFFGTGAGVSNMDGPRNSFFGNQAGEDNSTGSSNSFFGDFAGGVNSTGSFNAFFGSQAGTFNITGSNNTIIGRSANVGGNDLTFASALGSFARVQASDTIVLGKVAGTYNSVARPADTVVIPGALNVIGAFTASGAGLTTTRISNGASGASPLGSADLIVEDNAAAFQHFLTPNDAESGLLFGDPAASIGGGIVFNNAATNNGIQFRAGGNETRMTLDGAGNLGIGTAAPTERLHVNGNLIVTGSVVKNSGSFRIDHPLDPANKYLYHSFVESPDMMNVYNGNIVTNENGDAEIVLPEYFETLNRDFRYQLTVLGQFAQAIVSAEVENNRFRIKTDKPAVKVSWQVTGIRKDPFAEKNRIQTEVEKPENERGTYLYPELYEPAKRNQ